ncbi:MAG: hypothetical protein ACAI25_09565 [Planctomycetota bacterium]
MTFFPDLDPCTYFFGATESRLKAVGWLLKALARSPWTPVFFAGPHFCTICRAKDPELRHGGVYNVFIPGDGFLYVAPTLILHYLESHAYAPPEEFMRAVTACPRMSSPEYMAEVEKHGPWTPMNAPPKSQRPGGEMS